jgi:hypothetical protein
MSAITNYLETEWMKYAFTNTAMGTRPTAWYVALHTADPGETGATAEVSGSSYARQSTTFTQTVNEVENDAPISFPTVTGSPYTVTHVSVWDAVSGGNCLYKGALTVSKALAVGEAGNFAIGELILNID